MEPEKTWWTTEPYQPAMRITGVVCNLKWLKLPTPGDQSIAALQAGIRQMGEQAAVLAKDGMAAKAQVAALQARVRAMGQWAGSVIRAVRAEREAC